MIQTREQSRSEVTLEGEGVPDKLQEGFRCWCFMVHTQSEESHHLETTNVNARAP